jgi:hypothetical protein
MECARPVDDTYRKPWAQAGQLAGGLLREDITSSGFLHVVLASQLPSFTSHTHMPSLRSQLLGSSYSALFPAHLLNTIGAVHLTLFGVYH